MRIALIGGRDFQQFPTISYGGVETCVENLAWGLHQAGKDFFCIVPKRKIIGDYPFEVIESAVPPISGPEENVWPFANSLPPLINSHRPDVIWTQGFWAAETLKDTGIPIICTFHEYVPDKKRKRLWLTYRNNTWYRFISEFQFNQWVDPADERLRAHSFSLHTGLTDDEYAFGPPAEREDYFLWVGGLNWGWHTKGLDLFVELARRHPGKRFIAYGIGNPKIQSDLERLNRTIAGFEYRGELKRGPDHKNAFARARAYVMPTQTPEPLGRTVIESMSKGTPVLGSTKGALPELIKNGISGFSLDTIEELERHLEYPFDYESCFEYSKRFHIQFEVNALIEKSERIIDTQASRGNVRSIANPEQIRSRKGEAIMSVESMLSQAMQQHQNGNLEEAERLYEDLLSHSPSDPDALNLLGVLNLQRNNLKEAERLIRKAIAVNLAIPEFHQNLREVLRRQGNKSAMLECGHQQYQHTPLYRFDAVKAILEYIGGKTYLEIGIDSGQSFTRVRAQRKFGVDPVPTRDLIDSILKRSQIDLFTYDTDEEGNASRITVKGGSPHPGVTRPGKSHSELHYMTSDQFFREQAPVHFADEGIDVAFVDGLHTYHQTYRDVQNVLNYLNKGGFVIMHDCSPPTEASAFPAMSYDEAKAMNLPGWTGQWCGDTWKTVVRLRSAHRDLRVFVLDCDFGLGVVCKGKPEGMLEISAPEIEKLSFAELDRNREEILNLKSPTYLFEFLKTMPPVRQGGQ